MNLLDLYASLSLDTSGYDAGISSSGTKAKGLGAIGYAAGQLIADGFELAVQALVRLGKNAISVGTTFETSMAKVSTIMDPKQMGFDEMEDAIVNLSMETGIAASDIAESVYNVISATGDTAGAVDIARQASMLATAGFTDTSSALSVLTTAMNAYGESAGTVEDISDSLIMVQNLGVTTVAELSSVMGKVIATGSAYGVNLSNIETGYVALTKAGIGTAEATTYMSGMMNELGKSGSDVSKVLKAKTGMSFGQLMESGYSLGDVLNILYESCDGDSEAFMNLWSSAEAGKAASAIAGQGFENFNDWLGQIEDSAGATETAYATMAETFQNKTSRLKTTIQSKLIQVFERIAPILGELVEGATEFIASLDVYTIGEKLSGFFSNLKRWISSVNWKGLATAAGNAIGKVVTLVSKMYTHIRTFIEGIVSNIDFEALFAKLQEIVGNVTTFIAEHWDTIANILEVVGGSIGGIITALLAMKAVNTIKNVVSGVASFFSLLAANPVMAIVVAVAALVGALVVLYNKCEPFRNFVDELFGKIKSFAMPILEDLKQTFVSAWETIKSVFTDTEEGAGNVSGSISTIGESVTEVWNVVKPVLTAFISFFTNKFASKLKMGVEVVTNIFTLFASLVKGDWEGVQQSLSGIINAIKGYFTRGWDNVKTLFGGIWDAIRGYVTSGWDTVVVTVTTVLSNIKHGIVTGWEATKAGFSGVWQTIRGYVSSGWDAAKSIVVSAIASIIEKLSASEWAQAVNDVQSVFINIHTKIVTAFNGIKTSVTTKINQVKTAIKTVIDKIKGFFDWSNWTVKLPHIPTFHYGTTIKNFGLFGNVTVPTIEFYAKAMNNPMLLRNATPFAMAGNSVQVAGEAGAEVVSGANTLMDMMRDTVAGVLGDALSTQIASVNDVLHEYLPAIADRPIVLDSGMIVSGTVRQMDKALGAIQVRKGRGGTT